MKYMYTVTETPMFILQNITTTSDDKNFTSFPAEVGNPNYDAFLTQVDLTDEKVHALPTDEWFEV